MFKKTILALSAVVLLASTVTAQSTSVFNQKFQQFPTKALKQTTTKTNQLSVRQALKVMAPYQDWMIGANVPRGFVLPKARYNIKGLSSRKFLQYEKNRFGINLGWTDNASASTATKRAQFFFARKSNSTRPIRYGEPLALAWDKESQFIKYTKRRFGINLDWTKSPSYEWAILGGTPGQPVMRGKDRVVLYNLKHNQPLIRFSRPVGGHIGWPDSKTWKQQAIKILGKYVTAENAAKVLILLGL